MPARHTGERPAARGCGALVVRVRERDRPRGAGYVTFGNDISFEDFVRLPMAAMKTLFRSLDDAAQ